MPQIPGVVWSALATLIVFGASFAFGADQVGAWASTGVTVALAILKAWQVQQPADDTDAVSTRGVNLTGDTTSKLTQWWYG